MREILVIGSGIAGLTCAMEAAKAGCRVTLVSPYPSERAQSTMAAGGINAVDLTSEDSVACHAADTAKGGCGIGGEQNIQALCADGPDILRWLEQIGVAFTRDANGKSARRSFGGQSLRRTAYAGASTGKQIVTAMIQEARKYECDGRILRREQLFFHSALLQDGECRGALFFDARSDRLEPIFADAVVLATGGQNGVFGKTTGSALCDGYAAGKLFLQGALLKNLEFIQYHPTTIDAPGKRMLITEGARGDGGRLYYLDGGRRVYFMEDRFGKNGNLMPRDVVSRCIYEAPSQVYLDVSFLGEEKIKKNLAEAYQLCRDYIDVDITKESIPVAPSVHFFMGGLAVDARHRTNLPRLYAIGECASIYHGANRLGGNSLLSAIHGARVAAADILQTPPSGKAADFSAYIAQQEALLHRQLDSTSRFPASYILRSLIRVMNEDLGISRSEEKLCSGIESVDFYLSINDRIRFDTTASVYESYRVTPMLALGRAILTSALARRESRGAHARLDYPQQDPAFAACSLVAYNDGAYDVSWKKEDDICW